MLAVSKKRLFLARRARCAAAYVEGLILTVGRLVPFKKLHEKAGKHTIFDFSNLD